MKEEWVLDIKDQCVAKAFFFSSNKGVAFIGKRTAVR